MTAIWEDREVRFYCSRRELTLGRGEKVINVFDDVQTDKGENGTLTVTNLRVMWKMETAADANLSRICPSNAYKPLKISGLAAAAVEAVGLSRISSIHPFSSSTKLFGLRYGVQINAQHRKAYIIPFAKSCSTYERNAIYSTIQNVMKAYNSSSQYRNLVLRGGVVTEDGKLNILPKERIYNTIDGFWNLAGNNGNLGILYITNIRIVWFSKINKLYNGSVPYFRMGSVGCRKTRYGPTMVIKLLWPYDDLTFGFQVLPEEKLEAALKEILTMRSESLRDPIYGVFIDNLETMGPEEQSTCVPTVVEENVEIDDFPRLNFLSHSPLESSSEQKPAHPVYCKELGLAIETPPEGFDLEKLWKVI